MSEFQQFLTERERIDYYLQKGYVIQNVTENLSGSFVEFAHPNSNDIETVHVMTPEARKYFSSIIIQQKSKRNA